MLHIQFWGGPLNGWLRQAESAPVQANITQDLTVDGRLITYAFKYIKVYADDSVAIMYLHDIQIADPAARAN